MKTDTTHAPLDTLLEAVPHIADDVDVKKDAVGQVHLRRTLPLTPGLLKPLVQRLAYRRKVHVDLDAQGSLFWELIDGARSLHEIEASVRTALSIEQEKSEAAILTFTKMLMLRHLIYLHVPGRENTEAIHAH
jgi:hypothetical protein